MKKNYCFPVFLCALALPTAAQTVAAVAPAALVASSHFTYESGTAPAEDFAPAGAQVSHWLRAPQPVALIGFAARSAGPCARLEWATATEENNAYFNVERSADGFAFQPIGQVAGHRAGAAPRAYFLVDPHVAQHGAPVLHYRLRQVHTDGSSTYSPVRTVRVEAVEPAALQLSACPGPSTGGAPVIWVEQPTEGPLTAVLIDAAGRHLGEFRTTARVSEGLFSTKTVGLPSGVYLVRVTTAGTSQLLKLIRE